MELPLIDVERMIYVAYYGHIERGHPKPFSIYLGRVQHRLLQESAKVQLAPTVRSDDKPEPRATYQGMEIFVVDAAHHINFSA